MQAEEADVYSILSCPDVPLSPPGCLVPTQAGVDGNEDVDI